MRFFLNSLSITAVRTYSRDLGVTLCALFILLLEFESASAQSSPPTDSFTTQQFQAPSNELTTTLSIEKVTSRLDRITGLVASPTNPQEVLIVQGSGVIDVLSEGRVRRKDFLDIEDLVSEKNPDALFGISFSRHFPVTRFGYIGYVDRQGDTVISRVTVGEEDRAAEDSLRVEMKVVQASQHKRTGALTFGSDDALYIATGDGGYDLPSESSAQNPQSLLGKILRINVGNDEYTIPPNNPYRNNTEFLPEIFAIGLRDPFQMISNQELYVVDRGVIADEINLLKERSNFGWPVVEGESDPQQSIRAIPTLAKPLVNYQRGNSRCLGASTILERKGRRFLIYGDCKSGALYVQEFQEGRISPESTQLGTCNQAISALLVDQNGDLLIGTQLGEVYRATGILR